VNRKEFALVLATVALFSFVGGIVGSRMWTGEMAYAQKKPRVQESIAAKQYLLIDGEGRTRMEMSAPFGEPALFLYDKDSKARAWVRLNREGEASIMFVDKDDNTVWQTPAK
jgi:hypothetical protein